MTTGPETVSFWAPRVTRTLSVSHREIPVGRPFRPGNEIIIVLIFDVEFFNENLSSREKRECPFGLMLYRASDICACMTKRKAREREREIYSRIDVGFAQALISVKSIDTSSSGELTLDENLRSTVSIFIIGFQERS